jgi:hypothetical protein
MELQKDFYIWGFRNDSTSCSQVLLAVDSDLRASGLTSFANSFDGRAEEHWSSQLSEAEIQDRFNNAKISIVGYSRAFHAVISHPAYIKLVAHIQTKARPLYLILLDDIPEEIISPVFKENNGCVRVLTDYKESDAPYFTTGYEVRYCQVRRDLEGYPVEPPMCFLQRREIVHQIQELI